MGLSEGCAISGVENLRKMRGVKSCQLPKEPTQQLLNRSEDSEFCSENSVLMFSSNFCFQNSEFCFQNTGSIFCKAPLLALGIERRSTSALPPTQRLTLLESARRVFSYADSMGDWSLRTQPPRRQGAKMPASSRHPCPVMRACRRVQARRPRLRRCDSRDLHRVPIKCAEVLDVPKIRAGIMPAR